MLEKPNTLNVRARASRVLLSINQLGQMTGGTLLLSEDVDY